MAQIPHYDPPHTARGNSAASAGTRLGSLFRTRDGRGGRTRDGGEEGGGVDGVGDGEEVGVAGADGGHGAEVDDGED